jgi:hypothetical protein
MNVDEAIQWIRYSFPRPEHPCYHLVAALRLDAGKDWKVEEVRVNGKRVRDYWVYNEGEFHKLRVVHGAALAKVVVRCEWTAGSSAELELDLAQEGGKQRATLKARATAPAQGGLWNPDWLYYTGVVLRENTGLARLREPVHVTLAVYADRVTDIEREARVVEIDPDSGVATEIPSQAYHASTWATKKPDQYRQPTTTCEVAFLADVPAESEKVYLIFYGNPKAPAPTYPSDLQVSGQGLGLTVENAFYKMQFQDTGGSIDSIQMKMGVDEVFEHRLETNGAVQWNPDVYSPPRAWIHASDWNPPPNYSEVRGPIFLMTKRWGAMPDYPEIEVSITYLFYAHLPHMLFSTTIDVVDDLHVVALRNGEFVFNHAVFQEFAWKQPDGSMASMVIKDGQRHPKHALRMEIDTPWLAYYSREHGCGFGAMTLDVSEMRRGHGLPRKDYPFTYLAWGPWTYFSRVYTYSFGSNNPQRMVPVGKGTTYHEQMALMPFRLGPNPEEGFQNLDLQYARLADPLDIRVDLDTDERVPEEWVPPILVSEFEEMDDAEH